MEVFNVDTNWSKTDLPCECGALERAAESPDLPVQLDERMSEYFLLYSNSRGAQGRLLIRHCFLCGGKLPESKRGTFFTEPSAEEIAQVNTTMSRVRDVESMKLRLGTPDRTYEKCEDAQSIQRNTIYGVERVKRQHTYSSRWQTLVLIIHEKEDGTVRYGYHGQPEERPSPAAARQHR